MALYLHLGFVLAYFGSVRDLTEMCLHELGEILMPLFPLQVFLKLKSSLLLLLEGLFLVGHDHICELLCVIDFRLWRVDDVLVVVVLSRRGGRRNCFFTWRVPFCSVEVKGRRLCGLELRLALLQLLFNASLLSVVVRNVLDWHFEANFWGGFFAWRGESGYKRQFLP